MDWQEITVGFLALAALIYLFYYFRKQSQSHNCDDCGLMKMQEEKMRKKSTNDS